VSTTRRGGLEEGVSRESVSGQGVPPENMGGGRGGGGGGGGSLLARGKVLSLFLLGHGDGKTLEKGETLSELRDQFCWKVSFRVQKSRKEKGPGS